MAINAATNRRQVVYLLVRGGAALTFVLSALLLPHGAPAGLLCIGAGIAAVLTCIGVNAGGPGELAGSRAQQRAFERIRPPQGDWPPFAADRVLDGEVVPVERPTTGWPPSSS